MKALIILILAFLVLVYVYAFLKIYKRRKNNLMNEVGRFHQRYLSNRKKSADKTNSSEEETYITKYNSSVDYISYKDLMPEDDTLSDHTAGDTAAELEAFLKENS